MSECQCGRNIPCCQPAADEIERLQAIIRRHAMYVAGKRDGTVAAFEEAAKEVAVFYVDSPRRKDLITKLRAKAKEVAG